MPVKYVEGKFPPHNLNWEKIVPYLGPTSAAIARYDGLLYAIPNASVLLSPLTTQEAVLSSKIEGTQATMGEVLAFEANNKSKFSEEKMNDIQEILNYRRAVRHAMQLLEKLPLSQRVIREVHKILMDSVRGHGKSPGEYRKIPNWIGRPGCSIEEAKYIPVSAEKLPEAISNLEKYMNTDSVPDKLVQLALIHAEFEAVHPFLDGNGRVGRMLIPLFLWQAKIIQQPMFYISSYLESNRDEYYERLLAISRDNNWTDWCLFFLKALKYQAEDNEKKARAIMDLYNVKKEKLISMTHSQYSILALDWIFEQPVFTSTDFVVSAKIPAPTARRILTIFRENNILDVYEEAAGRKSAFYGFSELLNIVEGREVF